MKRTLSILCLLISVTLHAQDDMSTVKAQRGWLFMASTTYDVPLADMADRFGNSYTFGGGFIHKSENNIYLQIFSEFIQGNSVKQRDMYANLGLNDQQLYDFNGNLRNIELQEIGLNIGVGVGKTFLLKKEKSLDNGINVMTSLSLLQHRINNVDRDGAIPQTIGKYAKGYDHLSNGLCINQSVSYMHYSKRSVANYSLGMNVRLGFTKNRRSLDYNSGMQDDQLRSDFMIGLQFRWLLPLFKKFDTDVYF